jgi:endonuclease I
VSNQWKTVSHREQCNADKYGGVFSQVFLKTIKDSDEETKLLNTWRNMKPRGRWGRKENKVTGVS